MLEKTPRRKPWASVGAEPWRQESSQDSPHPSRRGAQVGGGCPLLSQEEVSTPLHHRLPQAWRPQVFGFHKGSPSALLPWGSRTLTNWPAGWRAVFPPSPKSVQSALTGLPGTHLPEPPPSTAPCQSTEPGRETTACTEKFHYFINKILQKSLSSGKVMRYTWPSPTFNA